MKDQILVFEDNNASFSDLERGFKKCGSHAILARFDATKTKGGYVKPKDLDKLFSSKAAVGLVVLDQDLSMYQGTTVSSAEVKEACLRNGVPLCVYATKNEEYRVKEYMAWSDAQIALDSRDPMEDIAKKSIAIYQGFSTLRSAFEKAKSRKKDARSVLHEVLQAPLAAEAQIKQYAWGDRQLLAKVQSPIHSRSMATMAGYWIFNVLLRFPGVVLNEVAAASYLGISPASFADKNIRRLFVDAEYRGPFCGLGEYWWAAKLDEIIGKMEGDQYMRGWNYATKVGVTVKKISCAEGRHSGAGYFCIVTGQPVCLKHSDSPSGWLPLGADRSRISRTKYRQLSPYLGI